MTKNQQKLTGLIRESQGNIADRFDSLDDTTPIIIFETPCEIGIYRTEVNSPDIERVRTITSGEEVPQKIASMSKRTFYRQNMLATLCTNEMKRDRPINYYRI